MITIISPSRYKVNKKRLRKVAADKLLEHGIAEGNEVNVIFAGRTKLKELSTRYKQENVALPVLTFIYNEPSDNSKYLGEIFICYPQAILMAAQKGRRVDDTIERLLIHGLDNIIKNI